MRIPVSRLLAQAGSPHRRSLPLPPRRWQANVKSVCLSDPQATSLSGLASKKRVYRPTQTGPDNRTVDSQSDREQFSEKKEAAANYEGTSPSSSSQFSSRRLLLSRRSYRMWDGISLLSVSSLAAAAVAVPLPFPPQKKNNCKLLCD